VGYLRPLKRNLVDILVTKELLPYALDTANLLFSQLETRGHSVGLAPSGSNFQRPPLRLYEGQNFDITRETWWPARETVASFGSIAFGLTIYEMTESADVVYQWDGPIRYVRTSQLTGKRRSTWADSIRKEHMPCGRLALRAYSPYHGATWEQHWGESKPGELVGIFETIVKRLKGAVPTIVAQIEAARKQAEIEHQRWQAQWEEFQRQERKRKQEQALKESRQHLLSIVEAWSLARNIEGFFEDAEQRAKGLPESDNARILDRLKTARLMLGGTDALRRFAEWKSASDLVGSE
jgi:hypothetical protein